MDIVTRTILNCIHKYSRTILLRLCKQSHHATIINRARASNNLRSFPERYKTFLSCRRHESDTINETNKSHHGKTYYVREMMKTRSLLERYVHDQGTIFSSIEEPANINYEEMCELCTTNWFNKSTDELLHALKLLAFSYTYGVPYDWQFSHSIYNAYLKKLPEFEDNQIKLLLQYLIMLKRKINALPIRNRFMKALNKECLKRFYPSTVKQLLLITDAFYQLNDFNSDYIKLAMRNLCANPEKLGKQEFIQTLFYLYLETVKKNVNIHEMEDHFRESIQDFSANEIAIITRCHFLNERAIRDKRMLINIIKKTIDSIRNMDSSSIAYVMKVLRYGSRSFFPKRFKELLDNLTEELPRLSLSCIIQITYTFAVMNMYNEALTNGILKIVVENMHRMTLQDIEQIVLSICTVTPFTDYYTDICHKFANQILTTYKTNRAKEIYKFFKPTMDKTNRSIYYKIMDYLLVRLIQMIVTYEILILSHIKYSYPLSLVRIVMFLTMRNIYVPELLQFIYSPDNLRRLYQIYHMNVTRELLILHCSVKIELPQYEGPLLPPEWHNFLMQKYGSKDDVHKTDMLVPIKSEIVHICKNKLGVNLFADFIIPHYSKKDLIFGMDDQNNPVDVEFILSAMPQGSIKSVNSDELKAIKWHVIIVTYGHLLLDHGGYIGRIHTKCRQLRILGYIPIIIREKEWTEIAEDEKEGFVRKLIYRDVRCSLTI